MKLRKIPKKVIDQTRRGFEEVKQGKGISLNEAMKRLKKLEKRPKR